MRFEVNGQAYFLNYLDEEGSWFLFRPGVRGIEQIPVEEDSGQRLFGGIIIPFEEEGNSKIH